MDSLYVLNPEFDYNTLIWMLREYRRPRDRVTQLLEKKLIIRVKKGLYVRSDPLAPPYSVYVLANLVYGPSYVSGISSLAHWGAIPERVHFIQSVTSNRSRRFETPVGVFSYQKSSLELYPLALERVSLDANRFFLISSREKALLEHMEATWNKARMCVEEVAAWVHSMRIDPEFLGSLRLTKLRSLAPHYKPHMVEHLIAVIREIRSR